MRRMMTDQQYQALVARSGGSSASSQLLLGQAPHSPYVPASLYHERAPATEAYIPAAPRSDRYAAEAQDIRAQLGAAAAAAADRRPLLPSPTALVEYPAAAAYSDPHGRSRASASAAPPLSPDVLHHYVSPQRAAASSELLARPARPRPSDLDLDAAAYPSGYANGARRIAPAAAPVAGYDDPQALYPGVLGPGGGAPPAPRQSRDLDRYLLAVQPEKLVRYAASCLPPDPPILRPGAYPAVIGSNNGYNNGYNNDGYNNNAGAHTEDDMYSNYRRAEAQRLKKRGEFRGSSPSRARRGSYTERGEQYRPRDEKRGRRGGGAGDDRTKRSSDTNNGAGRAKNGPAKTASQHAEPGEGKGEQQQQQHCNGGPSQQNKRSRSTFASGTEPANRGGGSEVRPQAKGGDADDEHRKNNGEATQDSDSELGSLCADLSDSEPEKAKKSEKEKAKKSEEEKAKKSEEEKAKKSEGAKASVTDGPLAGMIFICSSATFLECMRLQLFGLPAKNRDEVMRVAPGTKVFLFNFDTKELSGIFEAVSPGGWQIQPEAFRDFGGFPSQVQVCCSEQCPNIPQSVFKPAIKTNYVTSTRFKFDLTSKQVKDLVRLFRQAARGRPNQYGNLPSPYINAQLSKEYIAKSGEQQRLFSRQHQARSGKSRVSYARVVSMSPKTKVRKSSKASKRTRKKRKVSTPKSPMADNCILYSQPGEISTPSVAISPSKCCGCCHAPNRNYAVIVREGVETGHARNADQQTDIVGNLGSNAAPKGMDSSGPDRRLSPSKPEEMQSDTGTQVSFVEDLYNDGNVRLAGCRADEQGKGEGPAVPRGALPTCGDVINSPDFTNSALHEGLCTEGKGVNEYPRLITQGDEVQPLTLGIDGDEQLRAVKENKSRRCSFQEPENNNEDFSTCESICIHKDADDKVCNVNVESSEDKPDCELLHERQQEEMVEIINDAADCRLAENGKVEVLREPVRDKTHCEVLYLQRQEHLVGTVVDDTCGMVVHVERLEVSRGTIKHTADCELTDQLEKVDAPVETVRDEAECEVPLFDEGGLVETATDKAATQEASVETVEDAASGESLHFYKKGEVGETDNHDGDREFLRTETQEVLAEPFEDDGDCDLLHVKEQEGLVTGEHEADYELLHIDRKIMVPPEDGRCPDNESEFILIEAEAPEEEVLTAQADEEAEEKVQDEETEKDLICKNDCDDDDEKEGILEGGVGIDLCSMGGDVDQCSRSSEHPSCDLD